MGGTMGSQGGYHGCPMGRIPKPPGPQGTLGPLGPLGLIGPQGLMASQGTQGSGSMAWMWRSKGLWPANSAPSRPARGRVNLPQQLVGLEDWRACTYEPASTRPEARGLGGLK